MKRILSILFVVLLAASSGFAESFFPTMDDMFGDTMPSFTSVLNRPCDQEEALDDGILLTYNYISEEEYLAYGRYLAACDCSVHDVTVDGSLLRCIISKSDANLVFTYNFDTKEASVLYPNGTRVEQERITDAKQADSILPDLAEAFGVALPSMQPVHDFRFSVIELQNGGVEFKYEDVSEDEYAVFGRYLAFYGCELNSFEFRDNTAYATLYKSDTLFNFEYDSINHTAVLRYPHMAYISDIEYSDNPSTQGLLPVGESVFGVFLPRIALLTGLESDGLDMMEDGQYVETYSHFTDDDYEQFSEGLLSKGCKLIDYKLENGILTIKLERKDAPFTFSYDRENEVATITYSAGTRPEPTYTPEPTPTPTPKPEVTPTPTAPPQLSIDTCWQTAERYFNNLRWKNPESVTIHSYNVSISNTDEGNPEYCFSIDYSAMNGFGGYNRKTGFIWVDAVNNRVTNAWID